MYSGLRCIFTYKNDDFNNDRLTVLRPKKKDVLLNGVALSQSN